MLSAWADADIDDGSEELYFTKYAKQILGDESCWGLISAPLGNTKNREKYAKVLKNLLEELSSEEVGLDKFHQIRGQFLAQYTKVENLREELMQISQKENFGDERLKRDLIDNNFISELGSSDIALMTKAQSSNPWFDESYNKERKKLFVLSYKLHKEFVLSSRFLRKNLDHLYNV